MRKKIWMLLVCLMLAAACGVSVQAGMFTSSEEEEQNKLLDGAFPIDAATFPDGAFRGYLMEMSRERYEYWKPVMVGYLVPEEITVFPDLDNRGIRSLEGIEVFSNLKAIRCQFNQLTSLDLSKNKKLENALFTGNSLESVNVGNLTNLIIFRFDDNRLSHIDVSACPNLQEISCRFNQLKSIDVSNNRSLEYLICNKNQISELDLTNNTRLIRLAADDNYINSIRLAGSMPALKYINVAYNRLKSIPAQWERMSSAYVTPQREVDVVADESMKIPFSALDGFGHKFQWYYGGTDEVKLFGITVDDANDQFILEPFEGNKKDVSFEAISINSDGERIGSANCIIHVTKKVTEAEKPKPEEKVNQPTLVSAKVVGHKQIQVKWKPVSKAEGYRLYRKTPSSSWKKITDLSGVTYIDKNVTLGQTYIYTVKACKKTDEKTIWSTYDKTGVTVLAVPDAPKLQKTTSTSKGITVKWLKDTQAKSYLVYRKDPGGSWKRIKTGVKGTSYTDTTAKKNKAYQYTVRCVYTISGKNVYSLYDKTGIKGVRK